jgi:uncharacterized zinc-type alcohol dehydrogenase-like protein
MSTAKAFAANAATSARGVISTPRRAVGPDDVEFRIEFCGVYHSDLHTARNEWAGYRYSAFPHQENDPAEPYGFSVLIVCKILG